MSRTRPAQYIIMDIFDSVKSDILAFRDERDWEQFHNPKDLAIALSIEASELLQEFLWKESDTANADELEEELADVVIYSILLADRCGINLHSAIQSKLELNKERYLVGKSRGTAEKYTAL